jgi:DNA-directed RNA polymerase specialized sigma24 family protein
VAIDEARDVAASDGMPVLALEQALDRLEKVDAELATLVELRAFGGLTIEEAAHVLSVSPSTAKRAWRTAKAWLARELGFDGCCTDER